MMTKLKPAISVLWGTLLVVLVALMVSRGAFAEDETPLKIFKTADEAAIYAVTKIYEHSRYYEYGGVVLKKSPGEYVISLPGGQHHGKDVNFSEDPEDYAYPEVASYHVHPCLENVFPSVFSPEDLAGARTANHGAYVLDECTGAVHYWAPGDGYLDADALLALGVSPGALMQGVQLSAGRVIGHIAVTGEKIN